MAFAAKPLCGCPACCVSLWEMAVSNRGAWRRLLWRLLNTKGSVISVIILKWCKGILPSPWLRETMVPKPDAVSASSHGVSGGSEAPEWSLTAWAAALPALAKLRSQSSHTKITKSQLNTRSPSGLCKSLGRGLSGMVKCELYIMVEFSTKKWVHRAGLSSQASFLRHWFSITPWEAGVCSRNCWALCWLAGLNGPADLLSHEVCHHYTWEEYRTQGLPRWWPWGFKDSC